MRYNLESTLPINAFSPRGGRSPFNHGMTLEGGGGGGGVLKPITNAVGSVAKGVTQAVKGVVQPVYNATLKNIPGVDKALVGLDKAVGNTIPGGWGTVASIAASFIPGAQFGVNGLLSGITRTQLATGLGALTGSGVMKKGHEFNLQGAIVGGAMAYGASQLSQGLQDAGNATTKSIEEAAKEGTTSAAAQSANNFAYTPSGEMVPSNYVPDVTGAAVSDVSPGLFEAAQSNIDPSILNSAEMTREAVANAPVLNMPSAPAPSGLASFAADTGSNIADAGAGIKNLAGFGAEPGTAAVAREAFMAPITKEGAIAGVMGYSGMAALEEQQKALEEQKALGAIGDEEYAKAKASIDAQIAMASKTVSENPFNANPDRSFEQRDTLYAGDEPTETAYGTGIGTPEGTLYAVGGQVDDMNGMDEARGLFQGNMQNGFMGGGIAGYAAGGMPRFLSGGGDGMSDSIKASINGTQEARLADGEFVIPADVVSHIGNGSSKAGAKQLYSMMDRVRQARVGTKKQGKKINPRKYMTA